MDEKTNKTLGEYIFQLANGYIEVLENIYLIMAKILYSVGNIYFNQKADIEDAIQDLLIELFYKAHKFRDNRNACAWVVKIYENLILNKLKHRNKEDEYISDKIAKLQIEANQSDERFIENHLFVKELFGRLSRKEQQLIIYRYWCNCSLGEMSKIMKKPKSTIESQLKNVEEKVKNF